MAYCMKVDSDNTKPYFSRTDLKYLCFELIQKWLFLFSKQLWVNRALAFNSHAISRYNNKHSKIITKSNYDSSFLSIFFHFKVAIYIKNGTHQKHPTYIPQMGCNLSRLDNLMNWKATQQEPIFNKLPIYNKSKSIVYKL